MVRGGCKRSLGSREQRSPKDFCTDQKALLLQCSPISQQCKRFILLIGSKRSVAPSPNHFWAIFPFRAISQVCGFPKLALEARSDMLSELPDIVWFRPWSGLARVLQRLAEPIGAWATNRTKWSCLLLPEKGENQMTNWSIMPCGKSRGGKVTLDITRFFAPSWPWATSFLQLPNSPPIHLHRGLFGAHLQCEWAWPPGADAKSHVRSQGLPRAFSKWTAYRQINVASALLGDVLNCLYTERIHGKPSPTLGIRKTQSKIRGWLTVSLDAQIASDFTSNPLAIWTRSDSDHCNTSCDVFPKSQQI